MSEQDELPMIEQLGKYRIDGVLGKGAMGIVYRAFDPWIERTVALKTIRKEVFNEIEQAELIGRFKNEAQAAGRLNHPNIVTVYEYGEDTESAYIAMEFVEGTTLDKLLTPGRPPPVERVLAWMGGLLEGLGYAHSRGVVHRDIKPANLLVTLAAQVKISDFGIARIESSTLTQAGSMIGTPSYMSPEQFRGDAVDGRSDLFSAAIVLYQLLTGARPFAGTASVVMQQILHEDPAPASRVLEALGTSFDAVLATALSKRADDRYPSARAFQEALQDAARGDPDATVLGDQNRTLLAPGWAALAHAPPAAGARASQDGGSGSGSGSGSGTGIASLTAWKREAFPDVEASLARQIGPLANFLLKKTGDKAEGMDHLAELLLPHIPSEMGRAEFRQALVQIAKRLEATGTGKGATGRPAGTGLAPPVHRALVPEAFRDRQPPGLDEAYVDDIAHKLVAIIGPIGRVLVRRALKQAGNRQAFLQLLASHIENPAERTRFLADAGAAP